MINVALFPIPNSVNFPGVPVPLHVFEPRYRRMVRYCIENELMMGVCHTEKVIHANTREQTREEALSTNQSTYKPCKVFSAGKVELIDELDDGRMAIVVNCEVRLQLKQERQTLPFSIWQCEAYDDKPVSGEALSRLNQTHQKIMQRLLTIGHDNDEFHTMLKSDHWQKLTAVEFSFIVNSLFGIPAEIKQDLLEMFDTQQRLEFILDMLNSIQSSFDG
jgi:hypothetical protein